MKISQLIMEILSNRTKMETYIILVWFIAAITFNAAMYWIYLPITTLMKALLVIVTTYIYYNIIKTYTHTRTILEE